MADARLRPREQAGAIDPATTPALRTGETAASAFRAENLITAFLLTGILIFGIAFRVTDVNWDEGQHLHPDERFLSIVESSIELPDSPGQYFDSANSPLNPYNDRSTFVYGTFPLFLNKVVAEWLDQDEGGKTNGSADQFRGFFEKLGVQFKHENGAFVFDGGYDSQLVGRVLSAIFDVFTIALVFELGRVLCDKRVGLAAAALLSLTVLHIQYSHFFGSETFLAFFVTAVVYFSVRMVKYGSGWNYVWAGVACGFAFACKLSALPVLMVPALAVIIRMWPHLEAAYESLTGYNLPWRAESPRRPVDWALLLNPAVYGIVLLVLMGLVFRVFQPYAFNGPGFFDVFNVTLDLKRDVLSLSGWMHLEIINPTNYFDFSQKFVNDIAGLRNQQGGADLPPNLQWIGRPLLVFPLRNIFFFGLGPALSIAVAASTVYAAYRVVRKRDFATMLLIVWVVFFFLFIARGFNPTMRYFIPIYPAMVVLASLGLVSLWDWAASGEAISWLRRRLPSVGEDAVRYTSAVLQTAVALVFIATLLWAIAFLGIYRQEISRVQASRWIHENVPRGASLSYQEWDDGLPLNLPGLPPSNVYKSVTLKPYVQDSPQKVEELVAGLDQIDYVIESSNRLYDSIPRIPARYPSTTRYYQYLFDGTLGFERVAEFHNYPRLFGIDIPDQWAEEAFHVYDHPKVTIWKKTPAYSHEKAIGLLNPNKASGAVSVIPSDSGTNALRLTPEDARTQQQGGTWDDVFSSSGVAVEYPALLWFLALEAAALAVAPLAMLLFRRLPDRGYLLAKPLGLVLLAYPVWLVVSLKLVHFTQETILVWLALMLVLGAGLAWRFRAELAAAVRRHWRVFLLGEALFLVAFLLFYEFRMLNADLWHPSRGGEKPMDLAYLTAVTRSTTLPPYDPWFAGGYINYYYMGQFFTATLSKLTTIPPEFAFNLAVPTFFALTVAGVFSVAYNLAARTRELLRRRPDGWAIASWSPAVAGVLAVLLVAVLGNLDGVGQMVDRLSAASSWHVESRVSLLAPVVNSLGGAWQVVVHGKDLQPDFDYWRPSRMMPPQISITEFPYFSFLFADLHAHMMAIPFAVLSVGMSAGVALTGNRRDAGAGRWRPWALIALVGLVVGSLRWLNSWDYPPFLLFAAAAVVIGERNAEGSFGSTALRLSAKLILLGGISFLAFLPFLDNYTSPVNGVHRSVETTPLHQYLAHFGVFLAAIAAWLLWQLWRALRPSPLAAVLTRRRDESPARAYGRLDLTRQLWISAAFVFAAVVFSLALIEATRGETTIAAMLVLLPVVAYLALRELLSPRPDGGVRLFVLSMLGLAFGLSIGVDLITINGDINRMNTVFKFYLHIWILLGLSAAFAIWYLAFAVWQPRFRPGEWRLPRLAPRYAAGAAMACLLLAAAIYPIFATPVRLNERFAGLDPTLDGLAYMQGATYRDAEGPIDLESEYEAIQWLRHNVEGTPVIMEGHIRDLYRWGARFSIYTGLPTVLGWDWHQKQQRGDFGGVFIDQRQQKAQRFYNDPDVTQALATLSEFDVRYVVVGQVEKLYFSEAGLIKFEDGLGGALEPVFQNETTTIYEVALDPVELAVRATQ
jgi:YYY domain-containing protein